MGELRVESGTTPLTLACYQGDVDAITLFFNRALASISKMMTAIATVRREFEGHVNAARLLLDAGAAVDKRREGIGRRLGLLAPLGTSTWRHYWWSEVLIPPQSTRALAERRRLCLLRQRNLGAMRLCVGHGANVKLARTAGTTTLHVACENGHVDAARLLLDKGADVNRADKGDGRRYSLRAKTAASTRRGCCWIKARRSIDGQISTVRRRSGQLASTATSTRRGCCWTNGAEVGRADKRGRTPLFIACGTVTSTWHGCCWTRARRSTGR